MFGVGKNVNGLLVWTKKPHGCAKRLCHKRAIGLAKGKTASCKGISVNTAAFIAKIYTTVIAMPRRKFALFASVMDELRLLFALLFGKASELFCTNRKVNITRTYGK